MKALFLTWPVQAGFKSETASSDLLIDFFKKMGLREGEILLKVANFGISPPNQRRVCCPRTLVIPCAKGGIKKT